MFAVLAGLFTDQADQADLCFFVAFLAFAILGVMMLVKKAWVPGVALCAAAFLALGWLFTVGGLQ